MTGSLSAEVAEALEIARAYKNAGDIRALREVCEVLPAEIERLHARVRELETERHVILEDNTRLRAELDQAWADAEYWN